MILRRLFSTGQRACHAQVHSINNLPNRIHPHYSPLHRKSLYSLVWDQVPRNICVVKKPWNPNVRSALISFISHLHNKYPGTNVIVEKDAAEEIQPDLPDDFNLYVGSNHEMHAKTDMVVTLGGDGTILHAASLFAQGDVPPLLSFSMGTLGFLLPFDFKEAGEAFHAVYASQSKVLNRFRLQCTESSVTDPNAATATNKTAQSSSDEEFLAPSSTGSGSLSTTHAMNDITIHRGQEPHLTMLDISVDGEFVTTAIADGVTVATPTGSTAYSLSSGGSIVHPSVPCILITPICPRSLSFRPLVFPSTSKISISVSPQSRGRSAELSVDGIRRGALNPGDDIAIESEKGPMKGVWCVTRTDSDWVHHVNNLLGFNSTFGDRHYELSASSKRGNEP